MKPGTPGFNGARLREAREARGLTIVTLAQLVGLSRQAVSDYERGVLSPQPDNLLHIASVLNMPTAFFVQPSREADANPVFFRSLSGASKSARVAASWRLRWVGDIVSRLQEFVELPDIAFPTLIDRGERQLGPEVIEDAATELRRQWALGETPIHNTVSLIEVKGGVVTRAEAESEAIDAFSKRLTEQDRPCIFLGSEKGNSVRSRFDAAHEIGHMVIHGGVSPKTLATPAHLRQIESEAHAFASAFLLPAKSFAEDLYVPTLDGMRALKPKWKTSVAAMIMRAAELGILSEAHARRLWINRSNRHWTREEPGDSEVPMEEPTLLPRAFEVIIEGGVQTAGQLLESLPYSRHDVRQLATLPEEFAGETPPPVRLLDVRRAAAVGGGRILDFPRRPN